MTAERANVTADFERPDRLKPKKNPPIFNLPGVVVVLILLLLAIHFVRMNFLSERADYLVIAAFAFIPASYGDLATLLPFPNSGWWSPLTYSLLHGDWMHIGMNCLWMAAFGTPVARRLGWQRFLGLTIIATIAGAGLHYVFYAGDMVPVVGASGAVSGHMGAAARFVFNNRSERMGPGFKHDGPALGLLQSFSNRQFLVFFVIWMVLNVLFGSGVVSLAGQDVEIAWQAHIGGFIAGLLLFSLLDPKRFSTIPN